MLFRSEINSMIAQKLFNSDEVAEDRDNVIRLANVGRIDAFLIDRYIYGNMIKLDKEVAEASSKLTIIPNIEIWFDNLIFVRDTPENKVIAKHLDQALEKLDVKGLTLRYVTDNGIEPK